MSVLGHEVVLPAQKGALLLVDEWSPSPFDLPIAFYFRRHNRKTQWIK